MTTKFGPSQFIQLCWAQKKVELRMCGVGWRQLCPLIVFIAILLSSSRQVSNMTKAPLSINISKSEGPISLQYHGPHITKAGRAPNCEAVCQLEITTYYSSRHWMTSIGTNPDRSPTIGRLWGRSGILVVLFSTDPVTQFLLIIWRNLRAGNIIIIFLLKIKILKIRPIWRVKLPSGSTDSTLLPIQTFKLSYRQRGRGRRVVRRSQTTASRRSATWSRTRSSPSSPRRISSTARHRGKIKSCWTKK